MSLEIKMSALRRRAQSLFTQWRLIWKHFSMHQMNTSRRMNKNWVKFSSFFLSRWINWFMQRCMNEKTDWFCYFLICTLIVFVATFPPLWTVFRIRSNILSNNWFSFVLLFLFSFADNEWPIQAGVIPRSR